MVIPMATISTKCTSFTKNAWSFLGQLKPFLLLLHCCNYLRYKKNVRKGMPIRGVMALKYSPNKLFYLKSR